MRRVLFLAYYFPPHGGGGVQRSLQFCRYLPDHGYGVTVVTGPGVNADGWSPLDETVGEGVPRGTGVVRVPGPVPRPSSGRRNRVERVLRKHDAFDRWWLEGAAAVGRRLARDADLVYASMSPFGTAEAAGRIAARLGKPWVADLRDPWALDEWRVYPSAYHRRLERRRMAAALASADAVVMNTAEAARALVADLPGLERTVVVTIPNGFDASDFTGPRPDRGEEAFRIVHAGHAHVDRDARATRALRRLLGGEQRGLDVSTRSHAYLLRAVAYALAERPDLRARLRVDLAGVLSVEDRAGLPPGLVRSHGFLPHREAMTLLRGADLLFLPMHDLPPGIRSRIVPGKTYEYLAAGPPILAAVPDGDARDLLVEAGNTFVCRPADVRGMARIIIEEADRALRGEPPRSARPEVVARYERRRQAAELAALFDGILEAGIPREIPIAAEVVA